ncbi:MAG: DUF4157 domain-containing protein [Desmonostoc geniculatum HA4340-LM1]|nr:DUF4157 domain-containing protein [Desmonostoc geniculatum HA4340-LM1]
MKQRIIQPKKITTDSFSIPALRQPTRGFGSQSSGVSPAAPHNSLVHDISRIPLRRPQTKLTVNQPGDIYEQQADKMAQEVVGRLAEPGNSSSIQRQQMPQEEELQMKPLDISTLQRESAPEEEEEELQMKPLDTSTLQRESVPEEEEEELQMKSLDISTLQRESVPEEEEEELQMKSLDTSTLQRESVPEEEEEELQMKSLDTSTLQRESVPEEEEELQMKPMVQRQGGAGMAASPDLEVSINQARGGGQSIADNIREPMEQAFGADFSGVKVHTDSQSDQLNQSIQARAFTTGQDVFFRQGEYNPGSRGGQELLAHELTHVVQQNGVPAEGVIQRKEVEELVELLKTKINDVNVENKVKKEQIIAGLKEMSDEDRNDPNFARALVEYVKARNQTEFQIEDLQQNPDPKIGKKHLQRKWTFRHYTTQKYETLQSLAQLEAQGINASKNTNVRDWEELGNQGYVFGLIAIDGEVPNRTWLSKMKYYAEYDLKELKSVWVSGDMLTEEGRKHNSYQGTGENIVHQLSKMLGFIQQDSANQLDAKFKNALEAKVPSADLGNPQWTELK